MHSETSIAQASHTSPTIELTLKQAVEFALEGNPDLIRRRQDEPVSLAVFHTAQVYPFNPQFQAQVLPSVRKRDGSSAAVDQQYAVLQRVELAHQQQFREDSARADLNRVRWDLQHADLLNVAQTERLFFGVLYLREVRDQAQSVADMSRQLLGVVQRRFKAGQASNADVVLARQEGQTARRQADLAEANYQTRLLDFARHLNIQEAVALQVVGSLSGTKWSMTPGEDQLSELVSGRPDIMAARAAIDVARSNLALARAARTPDMQIGPVYQRDEAATSFWGLLAQMDLPVVNTGTPLVRQRMTELRRQQVVLSQLEAKARLNARAAIQRYERARRLVEQSGSEFSKPLSKVLAPVEDEFKAGQIDLLQVFAVRTSLIHARQTYLDLLNELAQAAAEVTAATGLPAELLFSSRREAESP